MNNIKLPAIKGANEREIYSNFVNDYYPRDELDTFVLNVFEQSVLKSKNEEKSLSVRKLANKIYFETGNSHRCIQMYNKSLRYAIYKSENYAIALANRSAMLYNLFQFENCINDINLCLEAQCPYYLKPKVYLRKCESFKKIGKYQELRKTADKFLLFLSNAELPKTAIEKYKYLLTNLLINEQSVFKTLENPHPNLPCIQKNPEFTDASVAVELRNHENGNSYVSSCETITKGRVLFVEKAYTFAPCAPNPHKVEKKFCQYCLMAITNGVPCKTCVKYMYCTEKCRNLAWCEFHQWECCAVRANFLKDMNEMHLALRVVFKACQGGLPVAPFQRNKSDKYPRIYHLSRIFSDKQLLQFYAKNAILIVSYLKTQTHFFKYLKFYADEGEECLMTTVGSLLIRHAIQLRANALLVRDFCNLDVGEHNTAEAICPSVTYMSHSCDPNTAYYFHNSYVIVKALVDIEPNTELTYSYRNITYYTTSLAERKEILWNILNLKCTCRPCLDPMLNLEKIDSYICIMCSGPALIANSALPEWEYKCLQCNHVFVMPPAIEFDIVLYTFYLNQFHNWDNINMVKSALQASETFLNSHHHSRVSLYKRMATYYLNNDEFVSGLDVLKLLVDYCETRMGYKTIENILNHINYCQAVLQCLNKCETVIPPHSFQCALKNVNVSLEITIELSELLYPPLLKKVKLLKFQHFNLQMRMQQLLHKNYR